MYNRLNQYSKKFYSSASLCDSDLFLRPGKLIERRFIVEDIYMDTTQSGITVVKYFFIKNETSRAVNYASNKIDLLMESSAEQNAKLFEESKYFAIKTFDRQVCGLKTEDYLEKIEALREEHIKLNGIKPSIFHSNDFKRGY